MDKCFFSSVIILLIPLTRADYVLGIGSDEFLDNSVGQSPYAECWAHDDCPATKVCMISQCKDPCEDTCGPNTSCTVRDHIPACSCKEGYTGDPFLGCSQQKSTSTLVNAVEISKFLIYQRIPGLSGCSAHDQCPTTKACIEGQCKDPCDDLCGYNTSCTVRYHTPACSCKENHTGDPFLGCTPKAVSGSESSADFKVFPTTGMKKFRLMESEATWHEALMGCLRNNSSLASVDNLKELDEIRQLITSGRSYWTSGSDYGDKGNFVWASTGKQLSSTSNLWLTNPNQPDNWKDNEDCVDISIWGEAEFLDLRYGLNDRKCEDALYYICEYY